MSRYSRPPASRWAFATSCPAGGTGITKVFTDVERLAALVPGWLATEGLGREKVARFYDDPAKRACDEAARAMTDYARSMAIGRGPIWAARRFRNYHLPVGAQPAARSPRLAPHSAPG